MPSWGIVSFSSDGSFTYTPHPGFVGTDTFSYQLSNGLETRTARVSTVSLSASRLAEISWTAVPLW